MVSLSARYQVPFHVRSCEQDVCAANKHEPSEVNQHSKWVRLIFRHLLFIAPVYNVVLTPSVRSLPSSIIGAILRLLSNPKWSHIHIALLY